MTQDASLLADLATNFTDAITTFDRRHGVFLVDTLSKPGDARSVFLPADNIARCDKTANIVEEFDRLTEAFRPDAEEIKEKLLAFRNIGINAISLIAFVGPASIGQLAQTLAEAGQPDPATVELKVMFLLPSDGTVITPVYEDGKWGIGQVHEKNNGVDPEELPGVEAAARRFADALAATCGALRDDLRAAQDGRIEVTSESYRKALQEAKDEPRPDITKRRKGPIVVMSRLVVDGASGDYPLLMFSDNGKPTTVLLDDHQVIKLMKSCLNCVAESRDKLGLTALQVIRQTLNSPMVATILDSSGTELDEESRKFLEMIFGGVTPEEEKTEEPESVGAPA